MADVIIRKVADPSAIFLTFDDGPDAEFSPKVLETLTEVGARATFFVIGDKAALQKPFINKIMQSGSSVASHSTDHNYRHFFTSHKKLCEWLKQSVDQIEQLTGQPCPGFRPPAGVLTPPLIKAAEQLQIPLLLWNHRFYDSIWGWGPRSAKRSLGRLQAGDIILLHDVQKPHHQNLFLQTLKYYLIISKELKLTTKSLTKGLLT